MRILKPKDPHPHFLNVDLDIYSKSDLQPLVIALGDRVFVLYLGRPRRTFEAHLEVSKLIGSPESTIREFCKLIQKLPRPAKRLWDGAKIRRFDVGIDSVPKGTYWFEISKETVAEVAKLHATIAVTVYGKLRKAKPSKKSSARNR